MKKSIFTIAVAFTTLNSIAQSGALDLSFDSDGIVTTSVGLADNYASSVAIQSDGKIVVAGVTSDNAIVTDFAVVRYNSNGSLDNTFGTNGKVVTDFESGDDSGNSIVIQSDGKIIVAGFIENISANLDFGLARYNNDGTLDNTFGTGGKVNTDFGSDDRGNSVVLQGDGKIVVAGRTWINNANDFALARYNSDGSLDNTFGSSGKITTAVGSGDDIAHSVIIQNNGKIVIAGYSYGINNSDYALVRYNSDGTLDNTFAAGGKLITLIGTTDDVDVSMAIQNDGKLVIAATGGTYGALSNDFTLARYNTDGSLDNTFGSNGKITYNAGPAVSKSICLQSDGKILVCGYILNGSISEFALVRCKTNGSLDSIFGTNGKITTAVGNSSSGGNAVTIQTDGKIVVAGYSNNGMGNEFAVTRYYDAFLGFEENIDDSGIWSIYPNPTYGKFNLINNGKDNNTHEVVIYNLLGEHIYSNSRFQEQSSSEIDISHFPSGIYFAKIYDRNKIYTEKIVVQ